MHLPGAKRGFTGQSAQNNTLRERIYMYDHDASALDRPPRRELGPYPRLTIAVLADLDLSDVEIGRYFGIPSRQVAFLRPADLRDELSTFSENCKGN
jgi:hypothetical protein